MTVINESGLYSLILLSKLPSAKKFKHWITSDVLPAIRKHGMYATDELVSNPDLLIKMATALKEERERSKMLAETNTKLIESDKEQKKVIQEQAPKVVFANAIIGSKSSILIGELAKLITQNGIKVGQNRMFEWMRQNGYLGTQNAFRNIPNQRYVEQGLFEIKKGTRSGNDGVLIETTTTKVTGKGQEYFVNGFLEGRFRL